MKCLLEVAQHWNDLHGFKSLFTHSELNSLPTPTPQWSRNGKRLVKSSSASFSLTLHCGSARIRGKNSLAKPIKKNQMSTVLVCCWGLAGKPGGSMVFGSGGCFPPSPLQSNGVIAIFVNFSLGTKKKEKLGIQKWLRGGELCVRQKPSAQQVPMCCSWLWNAGQ